MKKIGKYLIVLFVGAILFSPSINYASPINPSPPESFNKSDVNSEYPPITDAETKSGPRTSKWYHIEARDLINSAVENSIGMTKDHGAETITVGQAAKIIAYTELYLYSDHGYITEFAEKVNSVQHHAIDSMRSFECREVSEYEEVTRQQLVHLIFQVFNKKIDKKAVDPSVTQNTPLVVSEYTDANMVSDYYFNDLQRAISAGYICGTSDNKLNPQMHATLTDLVTIIERVIHANIQSNNFWISLAQLCSHWSTWHFNTLKIPTQLLSSLVQLFTFLSSVASSIFAFLKLLDFFKKLLKQLVYN